MKTKTLNIIGIVLLFMQGALICANFLNETSWPWLLILSPMLLGWTALFIWFLWLCRLIWKQKFGKK